MSEKIIEKLDAIEAQQEAKITEAVEAVKAEAATKLEETKVELSEKVAALEAKVANFGSPSQIKTYKSISEEVNRVAKEQLKEFVKGEGKVQIGRAHV